MTLIFLIQIFLPERPEVCKHLSAAFAHTYARFKRNRRAPLCTSCVCRERGWVVCICLYKQVSRGWLHYSCSRRREQKCLRVVYLLENSWSKLCWAATSWAAVCVLMDSHARASLFCCIIYDCSQTHTRARVLEMNPRSAAEWFWPVWDHFLTCRNN